MNWPTSFLCPRCKSTMLADEGTHVRCDSCKRVYPILAGIVDFRDTDLDSTAAFSFDADRVTASLLVKAYGLVATFNELYDVFCALREIRKNSLTLEGIDLEELIAKRQIQPRQMTPDQIVHGYAIMEKIGHYLRSTARKMPPKRLALENGCGIGFFTEGIAKEFNHVTVLDFSLSYLVLAKKMAQERGFQNVSFVCASVERLPFQEGVFDFIHSNNVIEHVSNQRAMFHEAHRVLNYGGMLFVQSPNRFSAYIEPHFKLPLFGFIPKPLRRRIIWKRQQRPLEDISLRSLGEVRALAEERFGDDIHVAFVPRYMDKTVTGGTIRTLLTTALKSRLLGPSTDLVINKLLLGIMPYHVLLCFKR